MWWQRNLIRNRRVSPLLIVLFLTACGFHPMYGDASRGSAGSAVRGNIAIDPMPNAGHEGQIFKTALEDKLNPEGLDTSNAQYHLTASIRKLPIPSVVKSDGTIQRYDIRYDSDFKLFKAGGATPILIGHIRRTGSYNVAVDANFASYEAEQDVIERTLQEMAEDYLMRLSGYLEARPADPPKKTPAGPLAAHTPVLTPASALVIAPSKP